MAAKVQPVPYSCAPCRHKHLEVKSQQSQPLSSDHKIAATDLSRYCTYLVAYSPELLPDDDDDEEWCRSLYKAVRKDAERVITGGGVRAAASSGAEYRRLVELLSAGENHEVLRDGARLARELAGLGEGEETAWKILAEFWSEMILYVAPSKNIDGHAEAVAPGGELITLLWALLTHLGVARRTDDAAAAATATSAPVN